MILNPFVEGMEINDKGESLIPTDTGGERKEVEIARP
jgi:hypothetical protein